SGKAARARPGEVDLDRYGLHFTVPYGWEVHEQVQKTDHAWCELRKRSRGRVESVIWIWSGGKIIDEAPGYSGIQKGSRLASLVWAAERAVHEALKAGEQAAVLTEFGLAGQIKGKAIGGTTYTVYESNHEGLPAGGVWQVYKEV